MGHLSFVRGASQCQEGQGKAIVVLRSTTKDGQSTIVPYLTRGSGVVGTRAHVHHVVTEYGTAHLFARTMRHRAFELIEIAHPNHRASLEEAACKRLKCMPAPD